MSRMCKVNKIRRLKMIIKSITSTIAALAMLNSINSFALTYDENIDGDFSNDDGVPTYIGELDIGTNIVNGTTDWVDISNPDTDIISFSVLSGQSLTSLIVEYTADLNFEVFSSFGRILSDDSFSSIQNFTIGEFDERGLGIIIPTGTDILTLAGLTQLSAGDYGINLSGFHKISGEPFIDYSFTMNVATVPIPAAAWLFGSGLIGLIGLASRKKA